MVNFDRNWGTQSQRQHFLPKTYLKPWGRNISSDGRHIRVYFIDKEESIQPEKESRYVRNTATANEFIVPNFYSRNIRIPFQEEADLDFFLEPILKKNYSVFLDEKKLESKRDLTGLFHYYNEWEIYNSAGILISSEEKNSLEEEILSKEIRNLEAAWDRMYENSWNRIRDEIIDLAYASKGQDIIQDKNRLELIEFMVSIDWRTVKGNEMFNNVFNGLFPKIEKCFDFEIDNDLPLEKRAYPFLDTEKENYRHSVRLSLFHKFFNKTGAMYQYAQEIKDTMVIELLIPEDGAEFITSDNPIEFHKNIHEKIDYIFPISPKLACAVRKNTKMEYNNFYVLTEITKEEVYAYNKQIKKSASKGYIVQELDQEKYFGAE